MRRRQKGQSVIEYVLVLSLVSLSVVLILTFLGETARAVFDNIVSGPTRVGVIRVDPTWAGAPRPAQGMRTVAVEVRYENPSVVGVSRQYHDFDFYLSIDGLSYGATSSGGCDRTLKPDQGGYCLLDFVIPISAKDVALETLEPHMSALAASIPIKLPAIAPRPA